MRKLGDFWLGQSDLAPVALFRLLYGAQLVNWIWQLVPNLTPFFTDEGILPRRVLLANYPDRFSLLDLFGSGWQVGLAWLLSLVVAGLLTVGWRSRLMSLAAFVVVSSWSWRDPLILDGSDFVFRLAPLWLAFTDCGALWSVDAAVCARRGQPLVRYGLSLPVRILELQVAWIYLASGVEKLSGTTWLAGTAPYYALQLEHTFGRSWALRIATNLFLAALISRATVLIELAFLPLVMIPSMFTRGAAVVGAAGLHLGILVLMNVGNFPVVMLSALVLFLPGTWVHDGVASIGVRLRRLVPTRLRAGVYRLIDLLASRPSSAPLVWTRGKRARGLGGAMLVLTAVLAFATAAPAQLEAVRPRGDLASLLRFLSVDQNWDMFSPDPARSDGWTVIPARLADGTAVDLLHGKPVDPRSERWSDPFYSRWVKVEERIASVDFSDYRLEYARYFCRTRNLHLRPGQVALDTFDVHYLERIIPPPSEGSPTLRDITLWSHQC